MICLTTLRPLATLATNPRTLMNTKFIALASLAAAGLLTSCKCPWASPGLTVTPTLNDTNAPITVHRASGKLGTIERLDPALDVLLDKSASIEKLGVGFDWSEGPVWMPGNYLLFSDVPIHAIFSWETT